MKQLRVAIIGQGRSGRNIHGAFFRGAGAEKFKVVAVVDAIEGRRARAVEEYGCDVYADYHELFGREDIDFVVNSTFSYQHAEITADLMTHGFNVICEKPFARNYEEGARALLVAKKSGKTLNIFQQSRFTAYYMKIREIVDSGILGRPIQIAISFSGFSRRWDWQTSQAMGGGGVRNTGPHPIDQALAWLDFDENIRVYSRLDRVNSFGDAEDYAKIILDCPGKPLIDVEISSCDNNSPYIYRISCSNGTLVSTQSKITYKYFVPSEEEERELILTPLSAPDGTPIYCSEKLNWHEETIDVGESAFTSAVARYYDMVYDYFTEGKPMMIKPEHVMRQLKVIDEIRAQNPLSFMV